jgi:hypothetical protein
MSHVLRGIPVKSRYTAGLRVFHAFLRENRACEDANRMRKLEIIPACFAGTRNAHLLMGAYAVLNG